MLGNKGRLKRAIRRVVKETLEWHWAPLSPEDVGGSSQRLAGDKAA